MARTKGLLPLSGNFEPQVAGPFDARSRVETKADLLLLATWQAKDGNPYTYVGMVVSVYADPTEENNGQYFLLSDDYTNPLSWKQVGYSEIIESETPPNSPKNGLRWLNLTNGIEYTYIQNAWVDLNASNIVNLSHAATTDKNSEVAFQHVTTSQIEYWNQIGDIAAALDIINGEVI